MSRGLGRLQRDIIATLDEAKVALPRYLGGRAAERAEWSQWFRQRYPNHAEYPAGPGWVIAHGREVRLADGIYDLRASLAYLARRDNQISHCSYVRGAYQAGFSRAVRGLVRRGLLEPLRFLVPIDCLGEGVETDLCRTLALADGLYAAVSGRQVRFVRRAENGR
jgi:hypothetical protein